MPINVSKLPFDILPHFLLETSEYAIGVLDVFLRLLSHVENGAVFASAKDVLKGHFSTIDIAHGDETNPPGAKSLGIVGTESIAAKNELAY